MQSTRSRWCRQVAALLAGASPALAHPPATRFYICHGENGTGVQAAAASAS